jgi:hypothetical protein
MMEQWNSGILGSGIMQCWINGAATGGIDDKIKMAIILLNPPAADHYSIFGVDSEALKNHYTLSRL